MGELKLKQGVISGMNATLSCLGDIELKVDEIEQRLFVAPENGENTLLITKFPEETQESVEGLTMINQSKVEHILNVVNNILSRL